MTNNVALIVAYDGSSFFGWQKTSTGPSIEQTLEEALQQILQEPIILQAASRTDRGVHARGQCVNFKTSRAPSLERLLLGANSLLPPSVRVVKAENKPLGFHPTLHAQKKEYHYEVCTGKLQLPQYRLYSWHVPYHLNLEILREAASFFVGKHDFLSFCNQRKNLRYVDTTRQIDLLEIEEREEGRLRFVIRGDHFLYKMVRTIVGTLVDVGRGKLPLEKVATLFVTPGRIRAGMTAPAHGLTLHAIDYPTVVE